MVIRLGVTSWTRLGALSGLSRAIATYYADGD